MLSVVDSCSLLCDCLSFSLLTYPSYRPPLLLLLSCPSACHHHLLLLLTQQHPSCLPASDILPCPAQIPPPPHSAPNPAVSTSLRLPFLCLFSAFSLPFLYLTLECLRVASLPPFHHLLIMPLRFPPITVTHILDDSTSLCGATEPARLLIYCE